MLKSDIKKLVGVSTDDFNRVVRYERRKYDINIESLIDENYGKNQKKGWCSSLSNCCAKKKTEEHVMPEGNEIEAV